MRYTLYKGMEDIAVIECDSPAMEEIVIALNKQHHGIDVYEKADKGEPPKRWKFSYDVSYPDSC